MEPTRKATREVEFLIDRYGDAIAWDLRHLWGLDLVDYFNPEIGRNPEELLNFINGLPRNSRYHTARSLDVDMYRAAEAAGIKAKSSPPAAYELSPEYEMLAISTRVVHNLAFIMSTQNSKKKQTYKAIDLPMPRTAADILRKERQRAAYDHIQSVLRFETPNE